MDTQTNIQFEPMPEQSNQIVTFNYEGTPISFNRGDAVMVNATEMAKPFGKQAVHWLNSQSANEFIEELSKLKNRSLTDLVIVTRGGNNPGTWMHEDVAMEFARWLSRQSASTAYTCPTYPTSTTQQPQQGRGLTKMTQNAPHYSNSRRRFSAKKKKKSGVNAGFCTPFSRHFNVKMQKINTNFIFRILSK